MTMILFPVKDQRGAILQTFWCPGCDCYHQFCTHTEPDDDRHTWDYNGDPNSPTFRPSLLCRGSIVCHSYVRGGKIQFLSDSQHQYAGKTMPMVVLDDDGLPLDTVLGDDLDDMAP